MVQMFGTGDVGDVEAVVAADYLDHQGPDEVRVAGPQRFVRVVEAARARYRQLSVEIEDLVAEGDRIAARLRWRGTRPDRTTVDRETIDIVRVAGGRRRALGSTAVARGELISFVTANYVARETGWAMHGWGHGDRATNTLFRPLETFGALFDDLLTDVRALGFDTVDLWGAHLNPAWATDEHVAIARDLLAQHELHVASLAAWVDAATIERACEVALGVGTAIIGAGTSADPGAVVPVLRERGVLLAIENHPEKTPAELLARIAAGDGTLGATVDTGWWATQGYDPVSAIEELGEHVLHVHLKDVVAAGEPHETCRWGDGIVPIEGCVRVLQKQGYAGALSIEHEPERHDPSDDCREMLATLRGWL